MKKIFALLFLCLAGALWGANFTKDDVRAALTGALDQAQESLKDAPFKGKTVAVLPISGDSDSFLIGHLKNILTKQGVTCVEGKEDPMWNEIIKEIAWDERKDDILDPATIVKFGKLKATQILLYGKMHPLDGNPDRIYAEIELHAVDLATKQHIWGGNFAFRYYKDKNVQGIITLDNSLRALLKKCFTEAQTSMLSPEYAGKLDKIKTVAVVPLAGDIDQYMTGLAIEILTGTSHTPKYSKIPSLSQVRMDAKDGTMDADAVFYGAVRDLRMTAPKETRDGDHISITTVVYADIQLSMMDLKTDSILWSKTITLQEEIKTPRAMTAAETKQFYQEKIDSVPDEIKINMVNNWQNYAKVIAWIIGIIVAIIAVIVGIKAFVSFHNVR